MPHKTQAMKLPINIEELLCGRAVEGERMTRIIAVTAV